MGPARGRNDVGVGYPAGPNEFSDWVDRAICQSWGTALGS